MSAHLKIADANLAEIESVADQLAAAMLRSSEAARVLTAAQDHRDKISQRLSDLAAERSGIVQRRQAGKHEADDAGRLALIAADVDGLGMLLPDAVARVTEAGTAHAAAAQFADRLRAELRAAEARAAHADLVTYVHVLGDKLCEGLKLLESTAKQGDLGGRAAWAPSREFLQKLKMLAAERGIFC